MKKEPGQIDFTRKMFLRMLFPCLASSVGLALADMADALVLGNRAGAVGLAAIGMSLPLFMILNTFMHGFGIGGGIRFSLLLSEGKKEEANRAFNGVIRTSLLLGIAIGLAFNLFPRFFLGLLGTVPGDGEVYQATETYVRMIAGGAPLFFLNYIIGYYLRNDGNEKLAATAFTVGNITDLLLNFLFVLLLGMGTFGAGLATLIGLTVTVLLYIPGLVGKKGQLLLSFRPEKLPLADSFRQWLAGFATSCQYLCQMVFLLVANRVLMKNSGEAGVAVFDMIQNASYLIFYLFEGTGKALQPLVSTLWGEKNYKEVRRARIISLIYGLTFGGIMTVLVAVFAPAVCRIFGIGDAVEIGAPALRLFCLSALIAGFSMLSETYYQSVEDNADAFIIVLLRGSVILLPATFLLGIFAPSHFWYVFALTEAASALVFLCIRIIRHKEDSKTPPDRILAVNIRSDASDVGDLTERIEGFCEKWDANMKQQYFVSMSAEEICLAIIQKGFAGKPDGTIQLTLIALPDGEFELHIRDDALSFDPFSLKDNKAGGEDDIDMNAMGMMVIKKKAKYFFYRRYLGFNSLVMKI